MRLREMPNYQSKYLRPQDLKGRTVQVTIQSVTMEEFFNKQKKKKEQSAVMWFFNKQKGLIINMTRLQQLESIFGTDDTAAYLNQMVLIHPTVQNGKETIWISGIPEEGASQ